MIQLNPYEEIRDAEKALAKLGTNYEDVINNKHSLINEDSDNANFEAGVISALRRTFIERFARKCDECCKVFNEGFCVHDGQEYYCSQGCLHKHYSEDEWSEMYADSDGDSYWTAWEDSDDMLYYADGTEIDLIDFPEKYIALDIETTGLNPWFGDSITCICAKSSEEGVCFRNTLKQTNGSEGELIKEFIKWLLRFEFQGYTILTKNGKQFDISFILARFWKTHTSSIYRDTLMRKVLKFEQFDLQEVTDKRISLQAMAEFLGVKGKSGTGENAIKLAEQGKWNELLDYCFDDVLVTENVFLKLKTVRMLR